MKIVAIIALFLCCCYLNVPAAGEQNSGNQEGSGEWQLLFDGKTTDGWRGANKEEFPSGGWKIEDGVLTVLKEGSGGTIITEEKFGDFELVMEFKLSPGANSGVKYYVLEDEYAEGRALGLEYQLLDDSRLGENISNHKGKLASLYDLYPSGETHPNPIGEWNEMRIVSRNNKVEHWLNGEKVLRYKRGSKEFRKRVAQSKFKKYEQFGEASEGHIMLQDHGHTTSFRNIKIREF